MGLLNYISRVFHDFYINLATVDDEDDSCDRCDSSENGVYYQPATKLHDYFRYCNYFGDSIVCSVNLLQSIFSNVMYQRLLYA
jgi:hypothetical protein